MGWATKLERQVNQANEGFLLDILLCQITAFIKVCVAFVFGLQILQLIDSIKRVEAQKPTSHKLLLMLWLDKKVYLICIQILHF